MDVCDPIVIVCPNCSARYQVRTEHVFRLGESACQKCGQKIKLQSGLLRTRPAGENQILSWLRSEERDD